MSEEMTKLSEKDRKLVKKVIERMKNLLLLLKVAK